MEIKIVDVLESAPPPLHTRKLSYQAPKLQTYGQVQSFTQGTGGQGADGNLGMTMM